MQATVRWRLLALFTAVVSLALAVPATDAQSSAGAPSPWSFSGKTFFQALAEIARGSHLNLIVDGRDVPMSDFSAPPASSPEDVLAAFAARLRYRVFPNGEFVTIVPESDRLRLEEQGILLWRPTFRPIEAITSQMVPFPPKNIKAGTERGNNLLILRGFKDSREAALQAARDLDHPVVPVKLEFTARLPGQTGTLASCSLLTLAESPVEILLSPPILEPGGGVPWARANQPGLRIACTARPTRGGGILLAAGFRRIEPSGVAAAEIFQNLNLPPGKAVEMSWPADRPLLTVIFSGQVLPSLLPFPPLPPPPAQPTLAAPTRSPSQVAASATDFLDFDLVGKPLPDVLEMIVASQPGDQLICQPDCLTPITLFCHGPQPYPETFLHMLLEAKGLALGRIGSSWIAGQPEDIFYRAQHVERGQYVTIRLKTADAQSLERTLAHLIPVLGFRTITAVGDPFLNAMVIGGHRDEFSALRLLIDTFDAVPPSLDLDSITAETSENRVSGRLPIGSTRRFALRSDTASLAVELLPVVSGTETPPLLRYSISAENADGLLTAEAWIPVTAHEKIAFHGGPGRTAVSLRLQGTLIPVPHADKDQPASEPDPKPGSGTPDAFDNAFDSSF